jgi:hypothetical protein
MKKENEKQLKVEITEMFCAQIDGNRMYTGCIKRLRDEQGNQFVFSRIVMPNGLLCARETEQIALGENLDSMAKDIIDGNLHGDAGVSTEIFGTNFFLN